MCVLFRLGLDYIDLLSTTVLKNQLIRKTFCICKQLPISQYTNFNFDSSEGKNNEILGSCISYKLPWVLSKLFQSRHFNWKYDFCDHSWLAIA